jgi:hypothetical protein
MTKTEFTLRSNIVLFILEVTFVAVAFAFLSSRFAVVYSKTPPPVWDNIGSYWWRDAMALLPLYILAVAYILLWMVARICRIVESRRKEREQRGDIREIQKSVSSIEIRLGKIENKLDAYIQDKGIHNAKTRTIMDALKTKRNTKTHPKR